MGCNQGHLQLPILTGQERTSGGWTDGGEVIRERKGEKGGSGGGSGGREEGGGAGGRGRGRVRESKDGRRRTSDGTKDGGRSEGGVLLPSLQTHSRERRNLGTSGEKKQQNAKKTTKRDC